MRVSYFTAPVRNDPQATARQEVYLAALRCSGARVVLGRFQEQLQRCRACGHTRVTYAEKQSDVALATAMVHDVAAGRVDAVMLLSADSDLCAAVHAIRRIDAERGTKTRVVTVFPPRRRSESLRRVSDAWFPLGDAIVRQSQLPDVLRGPDGVEYRRPVYWN